MPFYVTHTYPAHHAMHITDRVDKGVVHELKDALHLVLQLVLLHTRVLQHVLQHIVLSAQPPLLRFQFKDTGFLGLQLRQSACTGVCVIGKTRTERRKNALLDDIPAQSDEQPTLICSKYPNRTEYISVYV